MSGLIELLEKAEIRNDHPALKVGSTLKVSFKIKEGDKERVQAFEGVLLGKRGTRNRESIIIRKISFSHGVERIFPIHSPKIEKIEIMQNGFVRKAKLYYIRKLRGKKARIRDRRL